MCGGRLTRMSWSSCASSRRHPAPPRLYGRVLRDVLLADFRLALPLAELPLTELPLTCSLPATPVIGVSVARSVGVPARQKARMIPVTKTAKKISNVEAPRNSGGARISHSAAPMTAAGTQAAVVNRSMVTPTEAGERLCAPTPTITFALSGPAEALNRIFVLSYCGSRPAREVGNSSSQWWSKTTCLQFPPLLRPFGLSSGLNPPARFRQGDLPLRLLGHRQRDMDFTLRRAIHTPIIRKISI